MCYAIEKEWLDNNTCQDIQWCLCKQCDYKILKKIKPDMRMSILIKKKAIKFWWDMNLPLFMLWNTWNEFDLMEDLLELK